MPSFKIVSPQGAPFTIQTNATTWGSFKSELSSRVSNLDNMTVVVKSTKNSLDHVEATLPTTDDVLYITAKAIKAGK